MSAKGSGKDWWSAADRAPRTQRAAAPATPPSQPATAPSGRSRFKVGDRVWYSPLTTHGRDPLMYGDEGTVIALGKDIQAALVKWDKGIERGVRDDYLERASARNNPEGHMRCNPDADDTDELPDDFEDAVEGFKRFQKLEPRQIGTFKGLVIPKTMTCVGEGVHVLYRSDKWGEGTHDYIHEHEGGVYACRADDEADGERMAVPAAAQKATALYYLGDCLGFRYITEANETVDAKGRRPLPELYATPDGKTLFVIEVDGPRAKVVAALWGGKLDVRPEGIVG